MRSPERGLSRQDLHSEVDWDLGLLTHLAYPSKSCESLIFTYGDCPDSAATAGTDLEDRGWCDSAVCPRHGQSVLLRDECHTECHGTSATAGHVLALVARSLLTDVVKTQPMTRASHD